MAYATTADVEARLGRSLTTTEDAQVAAWLDDAALLIDGWTRATSPAEPYPGAYVTVSANMALRALGAAALTPGTESQTDQVGPFSQTVRFGGGGASGGVWLSAADRLMLRPYRAGARSVSVLSERYES